MTTGFIRAPRIADLAISEIVHQTEKAAVRRRRIATSPPVILHGSAAQIR